MKMINVIFFATIKDLVGTSRIDLEIDDDDTVDSVLQELYSRFPQLEPIKKQTFIALNHKYVFENEGIPDQSELALFPPVSGGMQPRTEIRITTEEIDLNSEIEKVVQASTGAVCFFTGIVREITNQGEIYHTQILEYDAYIPMAEQKMWLIAEEIRRQWSEIKSVTIIQRIGILKPGTLSVLVACSAEHRNTGVFEGARYGIDRLKEIVPIWKKEISADGEHWVEGKYLIKPGD